MPERFDEWVREAEERLLASDDYPLVDDAEIDMDAELKGVAHRTVDEQPEGPYVTRGAIEPWVDFFELRLISSNSAPAVRFVILNFLYRLAHFDGFLAPESPRLLREEVWPHFERFVGLLQDPGALQDPRAVRWEITNAGVAYQWDQATALYDRLKSLGAITASQCRALKGQMYVCSVVAPRDEDESGASQGHSVCWWLPRLDSVFVPADDIFRVMRPVALLGWGMNLVDRVEYSAEERARLSDAAHEWESSFQKDSDLLSAYRAAWGKCCFISAEYGKAAEQFGRLPALGLGWPGLPDEAEARMRSQLYQNAAECSGKAGDVDRAVRLLEKCVQEFPQTRGLWLKLARLYLSSPLDVATEKVLDCLRKEEEVDPSFGEDPRGSIALMLGEVAGNNVPVPSPGDLQSMTSVVSRHWPSFHYLDEKSRKEWVGAALLLWGSSTPSWNRALLRRKAAGAITDIVEDQLRRLLDRFRQEKGHVVREKMSCGSSDDKFLKYLKGSGLTLGEMIHVIDDAVRSPVPAYPDLKEWLKRNAALSQSWDSKRAWRLNDLRRSASHRGPNLSEEDAMELYDLSVWFVSQLYGD